jgi:hypothetical protein
MITSRERVNLALQHKEADRIPLDLGGTTVTGMHVSTVYKLRQALGLDEPGTPVKVIEPYQMLGEIKPDLIAALGTDVMGVIGTGTPFGFKLEGWKEWWAFDGTPTLVPAGFNTVPEPNGDLLMYPQSDRSCQASGRMPRGGFYFDVIPRPQPFDENKLRVEDNLEEFQPISNLDLEHIRNEFNTLYRETDKAIVLNVGVMGIGSISRIPGPALKYPKGVRDIEEFCISLTTRPEFISRIFQAQTEINLANLQKVHQAVGDQASAIYMTGTDFGAQNGPFISPRIYRELFLPFHKILNDWVHEHTSWKTFMHSCGSVRALLGDFVTAGFVLSILSSVLRRTWIQPSSKRRSVTELPFGAAAWTPSVHFRSAAVRKFGEKFVSVCESLGPGEVSFSMPFTTFNRSSRPRMSSRCTKLRAKTVAIP